MQFLSAVARPPLERSFDKTDLLAQVLTLAYSIKIVVVLMELVDLATGMRRGELLALRLSGVDLDRATVRIERWLE
jgi:integrase